MERGLYELLLVVFGRQGIIGAKEASSEKTWELSSKPTAPTCLSHSLQLQEQASCRQATPALHHQIIQCKRPTLPANPPILCDLSGPWDMDCFYTEKTSGAWPASQLDLAQEQNSRFPSHLPHLQGQASSNLQVSFLNHTHLLLSQWFPKTDCNSTELTNNHSLRQTFAAPISPKEEPWDTDTTRNHGSKRQRHCLHKLE